MNARPPDGSDEPEAVDQVMLAVLSNRGRDATVLSADQERLLDDWVAGGLAPDDAERAARLLEQAGYPGGIDPETGHYFDDTKRYVDNLVLSDKDRVKVYSGNIRRVYPRLDAILRAQGR